MIDASFVQEIQKRVETKPLVFGEGEDQRIFTTNPVHNLPLPTEPLATCLQVSTLTGIADYCTANVDVLAQNELVLHIESYHVVSLVSKLKGENRKRDTYVTANCKGHEFSFGQWYDHAPFMIALQAMFQEYGDRAKVAKVIGTIKDEAAKTSQDDGITQRVTATAGIALQQEVSVPNPVTLKPWRTFPEIDQPPSSFVLRVQSKNGALPQIALFEADGGLWKREAVRSIREYLAANTSGIAIIG